MGRFLSVLIMLLSSLVCAEDGKVAQAEKIEQAERQKLMAEEFGEYGKEPMAAKSYKELTWKGLKVDLPGQKNRRLQSECRFVEVRGVAVGALESQGYPLDQFFHLTVEDGSIPLVISRRKKDLVDVFGKLNKGAKIKVFGRVKEERIPGNRKRKAYTVYLLELDHLTILENDKPKTGDPKEKPRKKKKRRK